MTTPTFESNRGANTFTIRLLLHHFLGEEDLRWLTRFDRYGLDDNQKKALVFLREAGAVNNLVFRQLSGVDTLHASSALREMRDAGIIIQKGAGNATYYVPGEIILRRGDETLQDDGKRLLDNETRLLDNEAGLLDNEARLLDNERIEIALKPLKKRLKPAVLDQIVVDLCKIRGFERLELASLIKRNESYVRIILGRLVKSGRLRMKYPEMPNHPHQTYSAARMG